MDTGSGAGAGGGYQDGGVGDEPGVGAASTRGLSREQIRFIVMRRMGTVRACYETEARLAPGLKGRVTLRWEIDAEGNVSSASVAATTASSPRLESCIVREVQKWKFPPSEVRTTVEGFPFELGG